MRFFKIGKNNKIDIRPEASILNVFSRLSYKPWFAIAEFVDNSTQSYYNNVNSLPEDFILNIDINYDKEKNTLEVIDNAFGMNEKDFVRAVTLDAKSDNQNGRNEFGMGLKTAASWFGNKWTVITKQMHTTTLFKTTIDIDLLKERKINEIEVYRNYKDVKTPHGTRIFIEKLSKPLEGKRTIGKIRELLGSMYRRDIECGKVQIKFNGENISYKRPDFLSRNNISWNKPLKFEVLWIKNKLNIKGFVGLAKEGTGYSRTGFALFRHNRVVIENWKPSEIFGASNSFQSLRIFGELDLDDFPVNQAKDGFIWDDGLEDQLILKLKENINDFIDESKKPVREPTKKGEIKQAISDGVHKDVDEVFKNLNLSEKPPSMDEKKSSDDIKVSQPRRYEINLSEHEKWLCDVQWEITEKLYWIETNETTDENSGEKTNIKINISHPFFKPFSSDENFKKILEKFVISFVASEKISERLSDREGFIKTRTLRIQLNDILAKISKKEDSDNG